MRNKTLAIIAALALFGGIAYAVPTPSTLLQDVADGKIVTQPAGDNVGPNFFVVTVTGNAAPAGTKYALDVGTRANKAIASPRAGAITGGPANFGYAHVMVSLQNPPTVPTTATTVGAMAVGQLSAQGANLYMKCAVQDENGSPVLPSEGNSWAYKLGGVGTVIEVADDTAVTTIDGDFHGVQGVL